MDKINRLNCRGDWDDCDEKIIIRITGMVRLSTETCVAKAIGETRTTRVMTEITEMTGVTRMTRVMR